MEKNPCIDGKKILCDHLKCGKDNPVDPFKKLCYCEKRRIQETREAFAFVEESKKRGSDFRNCKYFTKKKPFQTKLIQ
jgi:hypothetical protein